MERKLYETPEMSVISLDAVNIICASGNGGDNDADFDINSIDNWAQ